MDEPRGGTSQELGESNDPAGTALDGVVIGCVIGIVGPFLIFLGGPALTLAMALFGFYKSKKAPEDGFWRGFTISCAIWVLINGACAGLVVWALNNPS